jgi:hypothetical protein
MKYSVGISNSRRPSTSRRAVSRSHGLASYNVFRRFNETNLSKSSRAKIRKPMKPKMKKILYIGVGIFFFIGCVVLLIIGIFLKNLQKSLPSPDELVSRNSEKSTQIFDRNGTLLYTIYGNQNREFVSIVKYQIIQNGPY